MSIFREIAMCLKNLFFCKLNLREKLVKTLKVNKLDLTEKNKKSKLRGKVRKTCQNAENKQTFELTGKNEIDEKVKGCVKFPQNIAKVPNVNKIET